MILGWQQEYANLNCEQKTLVGTDKWAMVFIVLQVARDKTWDQKNQDIGNNGGTEN